MVHRGPPLRNKTQWSNGKGSRVNLLLQNGNHSSNQVNPKFLWKKFLVGLGLEPISFCRRSILVIQVGNFWHSSHLPTLEPQGMQWGPVELQGVGNAAQGHSLCGAPSRVVPSVRVRMPSAGCPRPLWGATCGGQRSGSTKFWTNFENFFPMPQC